MTAPAMAMLFGFINTTTLHLAKGMQRQGIEMVRWKKLPHHRRSGAKATIYVAGVILNNLAPVWIVLANRYAPPAYATGMFGLGLVILFLYSHFLLGEAVKPLNYVGALLVIVGTVLFGMDALQHGQADTTEFLPIRVGIFAVSFVALAGVFALVVKRRQNGFLIAMAFGLLGGGMASLDPVLRGVGQTAGAQAAFFPTVPWGWIPFIVSFAFGSGAFFLVQYAFYHGADASAMVPVHTSLYVLTPVVVQLIALPGFRLNPFIAGGIGLIILGIVLTQMGRRDVPPVPPEPGEEDPAHAGAPAGQAASPEPGPKEEL